MVTSFIQRLRHMEPQPTVQWNVTNWSQLCRWAESFSPGETVNLHVNGLTIRVVVQPTKER